MHCQAVIKGNTTFKLGQQPNACLCTTVYSVHLQLRFVSYLPLWIFSCVLQHGKDFEKIYNFMSTKYRRMTDPMIASLTLSQVLSVAVLLQM